MKQSGDEMYNVFAKLMLCWHLHSLLACLEPEFFFRVMVNNDLWSHCQGLRCVFQIQAFLIANMVYS